MSVSQHVHKFDDEQLALIVATVLFVTRVRSPLYAIGNMADAVRMARDAVGQIRDAMEKDIGE